MYLEDAVVAIHSKVVKRKKMCEKDGFIREQIYNRAFIRSS